LNLRTLLDNSGFTDNYLKLDSAQYSRSENLCSLLFVYPEGTEFTELQQNVVREILIPIFQDVCKYECKFHRSVYDKEVLLATVKEFLYQQYRALYNYFTPDTLSFLKKGDMVTLTLRCDDITANIINTQGFADNLLQHLNNKFFYKFNINVEAMDNANFLDLLEVDKSNFATTELALILEQENKINKIELQDVQTFIGKPIETPPVHIAKISMEDGAEVTCVGKVSKINKSTFMKKATKEGEEPKEKTKFSFTLTDSTGSINVVLFPSDKDVMRLDLIEEGFEILLNGNINIYNNNSNLRAKHISICKIINNDWQYIYRGVPKEYQCIQPQPISEVSQMDFFAKESQTKSDYWQQYNTVVMFDLETTGLDPESCKIIEIGAVKIKDGSCVETFQTLINPKEKLSSEIVNLTHITDEMLVDAPSIEQVMPDFYKFVDGCVLSAYNISFDAHFLEVIGKELRYKFDNPKVDALDIARRNIPSLHNYKLGTVVKALGITLNDAHRALADAMAAAKVFIKLI